MIEQPRMNVAEIAPEAFRHLLALDGIITKKVDHTLSHLIKVRASQINGCAFCIALHTDAALKDGEQPQRLISLAAWPCPHCRPTFRIPASVAMISIASCFRRTMA